MNGSRTKHFDSLEAQPQVDCLIFTKCSQGFRHIQPPQASCVWHELNSIWFILQWGSAGVVFKSELTGSLQNPLRFPVTGLHYMWSFPTVSLDSNSCSWLILDEILKQFKIQSGPWLTYPKEIGLAKKPWFISHRCNTPEGPPSQHMIIQEMASTALRIKNYPNQREHK